MADEKIYLYTHTDLDGAGCAIVARAVFGNSIQIFYCDYSTFDKKIKSDIREMPHDSSVYMADICPNDEKTLRIIRKYMKAKNLNVIIYDHHISKEPLANRFKFLTVDTSHCGTKLLADHLLAGQRLNLNTFAQIIDVYDRWLLKDPLRPHSEKMNQLFNFMGMDRFVERGPRPELTDEEQELVKTLQERKDRSIYFAKKTAVLLEDYKGRLFMFVPSSIYAGDVADALLPKKGKTKYAMFVDFGRYEVSLRSRDPNFDVSKIAARKGGGGHPGAAGFPIKGNEKFVWKYFRLYMEYRSEMMK